MSSHHWHIRALFSLFFLQNPSGALQSKYILKTFAIHLSAVRGSIYSDSAKFDLPCGALALSVTAVSIYTTF